MQIDDPASVLGCRASSAPQLAALKLTAYYSQLLVGIGDLVDFDAASLSGTGKITLCPLSVDFNAVVFALFTCCFTIFSSVTGFVVE